MQELTRIQLEKKKLGMVTRARLRLELNLEYLERLNATLPPLERRFDEAVQHDVLPEVGKAFKTGLENDSDDPE